MNMKGIVTNIFVNKPNGFKIATVSISDARTIPLEKRNPSFPDSITVAGVLKGVEKDYVTEFFGEWERRENGNYWPWQFKVSDYTVCELETPKLLRKFLCDLPGVSEQLAMRIMRYFNNPQDIIVDHPDRLTELKGIDRETAIRIRAAFLDLKEKRNLEAFLRKYGVKQTEAQSILSAYGTKAMEYVSAVDTDTLLLYQERLGDEGNIYELKRLMEQHPMTIKCLATYLESVWQLQGCPWEEGMRLWHDYLTMYAKYYGHMPSRKGDMYPDSLKKEHDLLVKHLNEKKDEIDILNFQGVNEKWEKLCYSDNRFCIMLPQSSADLIVESKELGHCVRTYAASVLMEKCVVLFLRRTDKPAKPFFTMEFDGKNRILQIRGKGNRQITEINDSNRPLRDALISFLHAWGKKNRIKVGV